MHLLHRSATLALVILALPTCAPARADASRPLSAAPSQPAASSRSVNGTPIGAPPDASQLAWMQGHWASEAGGVQMEEVWTSPNGGALLGMHKDVEGSHMTSFEFLRIEATKEDGLVYFASPRSRPVTPFPLIELGDKRVVFENKAHDFPERILYWLDGAGALHARIEGKLKGSPTSEEWTWTKR